MKRAFLLLAFSAAACSQRPQATSTNTAVTATSGPAAAGAPWGVKADMNYTQARALLIKVGFAPTHGGDDPTGDKPEYLCGSNGHDCNGTFQSHGLTVVVDTYDNLVSDLTVNDQEVVHSKQADDAETGNSEQSAGPPPTIISSVTHRPETEGAAITTRITKIGARLQGDPDTEPTMTFADGHYVVFARIWDDVAKAKVGDTVTLVPVEFPKNCPKGDTRGVKYTISDSQVPDQVDWYGYDSEHTCGGA